VGDCRDPGHLLSEQERAQVARAKAGEFTGLLTRGEHGDWVRL
jgi:hypothetical protein